MRQAKARTSKLKVATILAEFEKAEKSTAHRKGTFKIGVPFERAVHTILKSRPHVPPKKQIG